MGRHLILPVLGGAICRELSRNSSISSTALIEEIPWDSNSKEKHQHTEVKKLCNENKKRELQLSLPRQFEMCLDVEEYVKV